MRSVFPLPLAPFEEYILVDDRPGYRMTFFFELSFEGELSGPAFEDGLNAALSRHPLFTALVERRTWRRPRWISAGRIRPRVEWGSPGAPVPFPADDGIDLTRECGVRFFIRAGSGRTHMIVQFHHACCDGLGAVQFLSDLFAGYVRHLTPDAPHLPDYQFVEPEKLSRRDDLHVQLWDPARRWRFVWESACQLARVALRPVAPLAAARAAKPDENNRLDIHGSLTRTLEKRVMQGLKVSARRNGVSVNDLLLCELFQTLRDWKQAHATADLRTPLGILVPTNLRNERHDGMSAANVMSFHFCRRHVRECADPAELLASLHDEQVYVKRWRFSALFIGAMRALRVIPGVLSLVMSRNQCMATAVLSCVGDPSRALTAQYPVNLAGHAVIGNLVLTDVNAAPPIRRQTSAAFTAWQFDERLRIGLRCDPQVFSRTGADELLDLYCRRIEAIGTAAVPQLPARTAA